MPEFFQKLTTQALTQVIDDNLIEKSLSFPRFFEGEVHGPNPLWYETGPAMPSNNGVVKAIFAPGDVNSGVEALVGPFQAAKRRLTWWVGPRTRPSDLGKTLQAHGLKHNRDMIGMAMDLHDLSAPDAGPADLRLTPVTDRATLEQWYRIVLHCFPISYNETYLNALADISLRPDADWLHYVGTVDGKAVAASSLFLGAGVAGLYNLGTHPTYRHRGVGARVTVLTFQAARDRGYRVGTLQTTYPNALRMYHRLGFEVYCKIGIYGL